MNTKSRCRLLSALILAAYFGSDASCQTQPAVDSSFHNQVVTVGGPGADFEGYTNEAVQTAVDTLSARGGGVVHLKPGTYQILAPIRLTSGISLVGAGDNTVLHKVEGYSSPLRADASAGTTELTVLDARGFQPGMRVQILDEGSEYWDVSTARIAAVKGNTLYIDDSDVSHSPHASGLVKKYAADRRAVVSTNCSLVEAISGEDIRLANLKVDGNRAANIRRLDGCRGGGVYFRNVKSCLIENVTVVGFNGDGISLQTTEDITVKNCVVRECSHIGMHPGTTSSRVVIENCTLRNNGKVGLLLCYHVTRSKIKGNVIYQNGGHGISIGWKDTDNTFVNNCIYDNARHGVYFRQQEQGETGNRNTFFHNLVENNGTRKGGYGFFLDGTTREITIRHNTIRDTGQRSQLGGVYLGRNTSNVTIVKNEMSGHSKGDVIDESGSVSSLHAP